MIDRTADTKVTTAIMKHLFSLKIQPATNRRKMFGMPYNSLNSQK